MKLYFEEYSYPVDSLLENVADEVNLSYSQGSSMAKIPYVGYFFNAKIKDTVFILPKVFISENGLAFDRYNPNDIIDLSPSDNVLKNNADDEVVFELSAWLYQAISHFFERKQQSNIGSDIDVLNVRPTGEVGSKTMIEIILSLREFHKKHKNLFTYVSLINSSGNNKVHWAKTISRVQPLFKEGTPYFLEFRNKNKVVNFDEELVVLFYSVLNYLCQKYHFKIQLVEGYEILRPAKIESLIESGKGTRLLKKIRRNYFTDELVELWHLLYEFFDRSEMIGSGKPYHEKLLVSKFNIVFEDMIDQLISDNREDVPVELREQPDGKIVDHIYKNPSLIEEDRSIYFIGDSKYYKETTDLGTNSIFKQFTYAKNVIQYNINLFNSNGDDGDFRYRDPLTEGYNITPNFFIRGNIDFNDPKSLEQSIVKDSDFKEQNEHFYNRLFDRDTLFLQTYNINFMFVVSSYINNADDVALKKSIRVMFRHDFMEFINNNFDFSVLEPKQGSLVDAVEKNFRKLNGKIYKPSDCDNLVILALDKAKEYQFENFRLLSQIEDDFHIYDYQLGTNPEDSIESETYHYLELPYAAEQEAIYESGSKAGKTRKYKREIRQSVLFGIYKDQDHLDWILKNKQYNVRLGDRVGAIKQQSQVFNVSHLVLYNPKNENDFKVYKLSDKHETSDAETMKMTGYKVKPGNENKMYFIYKIEKETSDLNLYSIKGVLTKKRGEFEETNGEKMAVGTPIYVYEDEL